jgi:ribonucleoside-diphosphate reductase alpha chain
MPSLNDSSAPLTAAHTPSAGELQTADLSAYRVVRRDGRVVPFRPEKIATAMTKAFVAAQERAEEPTGRARQRVAELTERVVQALVRRRPHGGEFDIEDIQDQVELALMRAGAHPVARRYVLYREERARARAQEQSSPAPTTPPRPGYVTHPDGARSPLDGDALAAALTAACAGLEPAVSPDDLLHDTLASLFDGIPADQVRRAAIMAARSRIEAAPEYSFVAARLLLEELDDEVLGARTSCSDFVLGLRAPSFELRASSSGVAAPSTSEATFPDYIRLGVQAERLDPALLEFDLERLGHALAPERDRQFAYLGLQTLYDRYLIHVDGRRIELPQWFWMRIAMGLSLREIDREARAIEFYEVMSRFQFVPSTPTLFNAGTRYPQLSSCYLTTLGDELTAIFDGIRDNALLSKFSGGLGNDWTPVRALGAPIRGTNGKSQGIVPFLKVANDTAVAVNQGGKRQGAVCAYLEVWHRDVEEFLDLRKNTGDDRRRTHDMHTALWVPDLFMQRVAERTGWTLFSPDEVPDLHDLYGRAFAERYRDYEARAAAGELRSARALPAEELWRKILSRLYETGHPWITFKDPSNVRSPQRHAGVIHSSNLCTEILLNTSKHEIAVCNIGSVNLAAHVSAAGLDEPALARSVRTALRMLDNVIDLNYYAVPEARAANLRHRPVGLGLMGFQDALHLLRLPYASEAAVAFADRSMEVIAYHAILASAELAAERGPYASFRGSLWDQGLLPLDTLPLLEAERDGGTGERSEVVLDVDRGSTLDWTPVRDAIRQHGMRNSNCMAIAPTATIANIAGVSASIEPNFSNLFVKSNLSGEFTVINPYLVADLRVRDLWDREMLDDLKYFDGVLGEIDRIPADLKALYATAFEIDPSWLIEAASRRQKWLDMGQSLNLYVVSPTGPQLAEIYFLAWRKGLKTTYYLRSRAATQVEKSTLDLNRKAIQPRWMKSESPAARLEVPLREVDADAAPGNGRCALTEGCEACE